LTRKRYLEKLDQGVGSIEPKFLSAFPKATEEEKERFMLFSKAYVDACYKPSYTITREQLEWLTTACESSDKD